MKKLSLIIAAVLLAGAVSAGDSVAPPLSFDPFEPGQQTTESGPGWYRLPNGDIFVYGKYTSNNDNDIVIWLPVQIGECRNAAYGEAGWPIKCFNNALIINRSDTTDGTFVGYWHATGSGVGGTNYGSTVPPAPPCGTGTRYQCP